MKGYRLPFEGLSYDDFYTHNFNSGVLLINNGMWRAENVTQDLI
ncbi:TPA: glycosyl transferase, partial [Streptococcus pneumoniae]|nr:glycosyl transferase [Streptococcus pneumoniae]